MNFKSSCFSLFGFASLIISQSSFALSTENLQAIIECKSNANGYLQLTEDYENSLTKLGWKRMDDPEQPLLYIYHHKNALNVFGHPTHDIALAGQAVVAVYRNTDYKPLAKEFAIPQHKSLEGISVFRGEKLIRKEAATPDRFTYYNKMVLSEMTGKSQMSLLGCSYEPDKAEFEAMLGDADK